MKILVCGGRDYSDIETMNWALQPFLSEEICVITGGAKGADTLAKEWAESNGIPVMIFPANWEFFGPSAGPIRNKWMLQWGNPDSVIAFPGGKGTKNMIKTAKEAGVNVVDLTNSVVL